MGMGDMSPVLYDMSRVVLPDLHMYRTFPKNPNPSWGCRSLAWFNANPPSFMGTTYH